MGIPLAHCNYTRPSVVGGNRPSLVPATPTGDSFRVALSTGRSPLRQHHPCPSPPTARHPQRALAHPQRRRVRAHALRRRRPVHDLRRAPRGSRQPRLAAALGCPCQRAEAHRPSHGGVLIGEAGDKKGGGEEGHHWLPPLNRHEGHGQPAPPSVSHARAAGQGSHRRRRTTTPLVGGAALHGGRPVMLHREGGRKGPSPHEATSIPRARAARTLPRAPPKARCGGSGRRHHRKGFPAATNASTPGGSHQLEGAARTHPFEVHRLYQAPVQDMGIDVGHLLPNPPDWPHARGRRNGTDAPHAHTLPQRRRGRVIGKHQVKHNAPIAQVCGRPRVRGGHERADAPAASGGGGDKAPVSQVVAPARIVGLDIKRAQQGGAGGHGARGGGAATSAAAATASAVRTSATTASATVAVHDRRGGAAGRGGGGTPPTSRMTRGQGGATRQGGPLPLLLGTTSGEKRRLRPWWQWR